MDTFVHFVVNLEGIVNWGIELLVELLIVPELGKKVGFGGNLRLCVIGFEGRLGTVVCLTLCVISRVNNNLVVSAEHKPSADSHCKDA